MKRNGYVDWGEWQYAKLVLGLLAAAGLSTKWVLAGLEESLGLAGNRAAMSILSISLTSLTMGFLFLAGAFGIWAVRSTQALEGRRRFVQLIDDMDYLSDGIVLVDAEGGIHAMNAAARALTVDVRRAWRHLGEAYRCLSPEDVALLSGGTQVREVERVAGDGPSLRALRFRSQPATGFRILLVSDVTAAKTGRMQERQAGHLQLIGRIARGVSNDFNNILCAISAHASLFSREGGDAESLQEAARTIVEQASRGSRLAGQVIALADLDAPGEPAADLPHHLDRVVDLLRVVLPPGWAFQAGCRGRCLSVPLAGHQLEHVLVHLGLRATEAFDSPGVLSLQIEPGAWSRQGPRDVVIAVQASPAGGDLDRPPEERRTAIEAGGVIESIVRSVVETAGGCLEVFATDRGEHQYVLRLPGRQVLEDAMTARTGLDEEQCRRLADAKILLASPPHSGSSALESRMRNLGLSVQRVADLAVALSLLEGNTPFDAAIIDRQLLGDAADALLAAIGKLRPDLGLVVLAESADPPGSITGGELTVLPYRSPPETVLDALLRARHQVPAASSLAG